MIDYIIEKQNNIGENLTVEFKESKTELIFHVLMENSNRPILCYAKKIQNTQKLI